MSYDLQRTMTVHEMLEWRFHWVLCSLWTLKDKIKRNAPSYNGGHTDERIAGYVTSMQDARSEYNRVIWEVKTMLGLDYESDLTDSLPPHPKYQALKAEFEEVSKLIMEIRDKYDAVSRGQVQDMLDRCGLR